MTTSSSSSDSGDELKSLSRPASESVLLPSLIRITPDASSASLGALMPRPRGRPAGRSHGSAGGAGKLYKWVKLECQGKENEALREGPGGLSGTGQVLCCSYVSCVLSRETQPHFWAGEVN